jgi:phosphoribosylaminoimidazolecarboxamide formyltransferase/IMP cyclohydrolase
MSINVVEAIDNRVRVKHVLISVSNKQGLESFVPRLLKINPQIRIFSTGGTLSRLKEILGPEFTANLIRVSDYTGQPETQGGLVKTLDFKIYLGLLTETYNDANQEDLVRTGSVSIDMVVVNLYPFKATISKADATVEQARGNIDIGGPCMIRASAKNFIRVAAVVDPEDYHEVISNMEGQGGATTLDLRFRLAQKAFEHTAVYDRAIADFLGSRPLAEVRACYRAQDGGK